MGLVLKNTVKKGRVAHLRKHHFKHSGDEKQGGQQWAKMDSHRQRQDRHALRAHGKLLAPVHTSRDGAWKINKTIRKLDRVAGIVERFNPILIQGSGLNHNRIISMYAASVDEHVNTHNIKVLEDASMSKSTHHVSVCESMLTGVAVELLLAHVRPERPNDGNRRVTIRWQGKLIRRAVLPSDDATLDGSNQLPTPPDSDPESPPKRTKFMIQIVDGRAFSWRVEE